MSYEILNINKKLRLVQLMPKQAVKLFELTDKNREYLSSFLPWVSNVKTVDDSREYIMQTLKNRTEGKAYTYGIELDGIIVGDINLRGLKDMNQQAIIGYWIDAAQSGRGLTTKAVHALTNFGIGTLGLDKIILRASPDNIASNRVAEKVGYVFSNQIVEDGNTLNIWIADKKVFNLSSENVTG